MRPTRPSHRHPSTSPANMLACVLHLPPRPSPAHPPPSPPPSPPPVWPPQSLRRRSEVSCEAQKVREHPACRHLSAGARPCAHTHASGERRGVMQSALTQGKLCGVRCRAADPTAAARVLGLLPASEAPGRTRAPFFRSEICTTTRWQTTTHPHPPRHRHTTMQRPQTAPQALRKRKRTADDERLRGVPGRLEAHHVVAPAERRKRVRLGVAPEDHPRPTHRVDDPHVAKHLWGEGSRDGEYSEYCDIWMF